MGDVSNILPRDPRAPEFGVTGMRPAEGAHPESPAGGPGNGYFSSRKPIGTMEPVYHATRGALRTAESTGAADLSDAYDRVKCVYEAFARAEQYVPEAILEETGKSLTDLKEGLITGLLTAAAAIAVSTLLGAAVGAGIGALGGGVGAGPGAVVGAKVGLAAGMKLLAYLGIAFLAVYLTSKLGEVAGWLKRGVVRAWEAGGKVPTERDREINQAAHDLARAIGVLFRLVLEAIVLYLLAKGTAAAAGRVAGLVRQLKRSRLGTGFAQWVERNWQSLIKDPRLNPELRKAAPGGGTAIQSEKRIPPPETPTSRKPAPMRKGQIIESERQFTPKERRIAQVLADEGKKVKALKEGGARERFGDAEVDGVRMEFKTMDPGGTSATIRNQVSASVSGGGQARHIIIDARGSGLTEPEALRGLSRADGIRRGRVDSIRIIGDGFGITRNYP